MGRSPAAIRRISLLGAEVDLITREGVIQRINELVASQRKAIIANQNLHSLYLMPRNADMAAFYEMADVIEIDSMPLVYWGRLLGFPTSRANRCTYLDWRDQFWRTAADRQWRVYCLGAPDGVAQVAADRLASKWRGVTFRAHHGYFDHAAGSLESQAVIDDINAFEPDVILVGMGMPIQEAWIGRNYAALASGVVLSVGAAFDYEAGLQPPAPRFLGALCLEWAYRLAHQPRRLFRRYMIEPWSLIAPAMRDIGRYALKATPKPVRRDIRFYAPRPYPPAAEAHSKEDSDLRRAA